MTNDHEQNLSPFIAGSTIKDSRFFVGRKDELQVLISAMTKTQPVSVNVVGRRRIGKSSLLYHFFQTYEQRLDPPNNRFVVIYISLQHVQCQWQDGLYQTIARQLYSRPFVLRRPNLANPLRVRPFHRSAFSNVLGIWKRAGILPVVCLDEFEVLFRHPQEFDNSFFDYLRSLLDSEVLMLIMASHRNLDFYKRRYKLISSFFNLNQVLPLGELKEVEARELVRLPLGKVVNAEAVLSNKEQKAARQLGGCHPFLLQLAASLIWEARKQGHSNNWIKTHFELEARRVPGYTINLGGVGMALRAFLWIPLTLGKLARGMGGTVDEIGNLLIGTIILVMLIFAIAGLLNLDLIKDLLQNAFS